MNWARRRAQFGMTDVNVSSGIPQDHRLDSPLTDRADPWPEKVDQPAKHGGLSSGRSVYQSTPIAAAISSSGGKAPYQTENASAAWATSIGRPSFLSINNMCSQGFNLPAGNQRRQLSELLDDLS